MVQYKYVAKNLQQEQFTGIFIAENENDLAIQLQKQGLFLVSCKVYDSVVKAKFFSLSTGKVSISEINTFSRQFAIMINTGISILGCLQILKEQKYSDVFRDVLAVMCDDVKSGIMFSDALNKQKKIFPLFFRSMIVVGEKSGKMEVVLNSLADYYEHEDKIKKNIISAFSYPVMLLFMTIGIIVLMLAFVVPKFRETLASMDVKATGLTAVVYQISDFLVENGLNVAAIIVTVIALLFLYGRTEKGRFLYDKLKVTMPFVKDISIGMYTAKFARSFGLLLSSGMDVVDAMEAVLIIFNNKYIEKKFVKATEDVKHGVNMSVAFENYKLFPPILCQMVGVGEKTNSLDDVLGRSCSFFDSQVDKTISQITSMIQPIMLLIMGGVVGTLFIAIYSPILDIMSTFGG